jgi:hypothetical protein
MGWSYDPVAVRVRASRIAGGGAVAIDLAQVLTVLTIGGIVCSASWSSDLIDTRLNKVLAEFKPNGGQCVPGTSWTASRRRSSIRSSPRSTGTSTGT